MAQSLSESLAVALGYLSLQNCLPSFGILGGGDLPPLGTFAEHVVVERNQVILTPEHLDDVQISAWPLGGVTAWRYALSLVAFECGLMVSRAAIVYGRVESGHNVLITGIGGGVALLAMQICIAKGATVYVTSGNADKIRKAVELGAAGGANYKDSQGFLSLDAENSCIDNFQRTGQLKSRR